MERRARPAVAAILALAVPGLGHTYLGRWGRAVAWFLTIVTTAVVLVGAFGDPDATSLQAMPLTVLVPMGGLFVLSAVDAYLLAVRRPPAGRGTEAGAADAEDRLRCPDCGREVDPELDFCHWCTRRLSFDADESRGEKREGGG